MLTPASASIRLHHRACSIGRRAHGDNRETNKIFPRRDPRPEERYIFGSHQLKASRVFKIDPAFNVLEPLRERTPALASASSLLRLQTIEQGVDVTQQRGAGGRIVNARRRHVDPFLNRCMRRGAE